MGLCMQFQEMQNDENDPVVNEINNILKSTDSELFFKSPELREKVIQLCNKYYQMHDIADSIPEEDGVPDELFKLQRKLVAMSYLPKAETLAGARWKLFKNAAIGDDFESRRGSEGVPGQQQYLLARAMREEYWVEARFEGAQHLESWVIRGRPRVSYEILSGLKPDFDIVYLRDPGELRLNYHKEEKLFYQRGRVASIGAYSEEYCRYMEGVFVVDMHGQIYANPDVDAEYFRHSSFLRGRNVLFAGMCKIENGKFTYISNISGHYAPDLRHLLKFLDLLHNRYQVDLKGIHVDFYVAGDTYSCDAEELRSLRFFSFTNPGKQIIQSRLFALIGFKSLEYPGAEIDNDKIEAAECILRMFSKGLSADRDKVSFFEKNGVGRKKVAEYIDAYIILRQKLLDHHTRISAVNGLCDLLGRMDAFSFEFFSGSITMLLEHAFKDISSKEKVENSSSEEEAALVFLKAGVFLGKGSIGVKRVESIAEHYNDSFKERLQLVFEKATNMLYVVHGQSRLKLCPAKADFSSDGTLTSDAVEKLIGQLIGASSTVDSPSPGK